MDVDEFDFWLPQIEEELDFCRMPATCHDAALWPLVTRTLEREFGADLIALPC